MSSITKLKRLSANVEELEPTFSTKQETFKRQQWGSKIDFILVCIGYCVGLSNVWRFPYLCYKNGGGAFLIPYTIVLILCVFPILCLEYSFGQFFGLGSLSVWKICPLFKGLGYVSLILNLYLSTYYIVILAWAIRYMVASFTSELPWASCNNTWNTDYCFAQGSVSNMTNDNQSLSVDKTKLVSAAEEYWKYAILNISSGIEEFGMIQWELFLCLLAAWVIVCVVTVKGIETSGKVVYFTATFPYVMITILVVRGVTLPGAKIGLEYYLKADWSRLADSKVWYSAAMQVFWSCGPGWGTFITMSSYNNFKNNCFRDAIFSASVNCLTSFYAGFAVFSVLGYMANELNLPVDQIATSGPGLAFIVYPRALVTLPFSSFWAVAFFFMIILLGIDSQIVYIETIVTCVTDEFPRCRNYRIILNIAVCLIMLLLGLVYITQNGFYIFTFIDWYATGIAAIFAAILECLVICWAYGIKRYLNNLTTMLGKRPNWYFIISWCFVAPIITSAIFVYYLVNYTPISLGDYVYPRGFDAFGWCLAMTPLIPVPAVMIYKLATTKRRTFTERVKFLLIPESCVYIKSQNANNLSELDCKEKMLEAKHVSPEAEI